MFERIDKIVEDIDQRGKPYKNANRFGSKLFAKDLTDQDGQAVDLKSKRVYGEKYD